MTKTELDRLQAVGTYEEWKSVCHAIKDEHGGRYPASWHTEVIRSGLADRVLLKFGMSTQMTITTVTDASDIDKLISRAARNRELVLKVDPDRSHVINAQLDDDVTGIMVRAQLNGAYGSYDIAFLDRDSLLGWLRSRGGDNTWAEDVVGILLGHGHLHERIN